MKYVNGILVTWVSPPRETHNGPLTGYVVSICEFYNIYVCYVTYSMFVCAYSVVCICVSVCLYMCVYGVCIEHDFALDFYIIHMYLCLYTFSLSFSSDFHYKPGERHYHQI